MTTGETVFLIPVIATFARFAAMLAYYDHQYRASRRAAAQDAAPSDRAHA